MLSEKIRNDVVKIDALFDYYAEISKRKLRDKVELENAREKMYFTRKRIIELTSEIKKTVKDFEERL